MPPCKAHRLASAFMTAASLFVAPVEAHELTLHNGLVIKITELTLRGGTVTGFREIGPHQSVTVGVQRDDGGCNGWLMARTGVGTANALIDICADGAFVVTASPRRGTPIPSLTVAPVVPAD